MKEVLITSSVLILALLLLRMIFAKKVSRRLIYGAWILVALRLLIPVQIGQLDFSVLTAAQPVVEVVEEQVKDAVLGTTPQAAYRDQVEHYIEKDQTVFVPQVQEQIRQELAQGNQTPDQIYDKIQQQFPEQEILTPEGQETVDVLVGMENTTRLHNAGMVLTTIWIVGIVAMAVWFVVVNTIYSRKLKKNRQTLEVDCPLTVYVSENAASPCLMGLFRPVIYLTPAAAASEETMRHVLAHELTHRKHGDHIWSLVRCVCLCVYWFHPLVWVAAWCSRRDCELACDEGAMKTLAEEERIAYGKSLVDVVCHASAPANLLHTATSMNETGKQLKERVNFIVKKPQLSLIAAISMVLVCAIVAGCAAAGPSVSSDNWERVKRQIQEDAVAFFGTETDTCQPEDVKLRLISQFDDTYVMFVDVPFLGYLAWIETEEINGLEFVYPSSQKMHVYKDGSFTRLKEAFETGLLSAEQLETVWRDYTNYKEQPPETSKPAGSTPSTDPDQPQEPIKAVYVLLQKYSTDDSTTLLPQYDAEYKLQGLVTLRSGMLVDAGEYIWDEENRTLTIEKDGVLEGRYSFDERGNKINYTQYVDGMEYRVYSYAYDQNDRIVNLQYLFFKTGGAMSNSNDGYEWEYVYDDHGKLQMRNHYKIESQNGKVSRMYRNEYYQYIYDDTGRLIQSEYHGGETIYTTYTYDEQKRSVTATERLESGYEESVTTTYYNSEGMAIYVEETDSMNHTERVVYTYGWVELPEDTFVAKMLDVPSAIEPFWDRDECDEYVAEKDIEQYEKAAAALESYQSNGEIQYEEGGRRHTGNAALWAIYALFMRLGDYKDSALYMQEVATLINAL